MLIFVYLSGYLYIAYMLVKLSAYRSYDLADKLLVLIVSAVPLGKLVYLNVPALIGFKFCFLLLVISLAIVVLRSLVVSPGIRLSLLYPLAFCLPALGSVLFLQNAHMFFFYHIGPQSDSALLRLISLFVLTSFSVWIAAFIRKHGSIKPLVEIYCKSLMYATFVGFVIFVGVLLQKITRADLLPVSADTHVIANFYRFNPGANVDEFGFLLGYGILFVLWLDWGVAKKSIYLLVFLFAEFLTLTRATWLGLVGSLLVYSLMYRKHLPKLLWAIFLFVVIMAVLMHFNTEINDLVLSRTALTGGPSGDERLEKYGAVYEGVTSSMMRFLFGFGWSSNLYVHSVPLQILYETGAIGFFVFGLLLLLLLLLLFRQPNSIDRTLMCSLLVMFWIPSSMHHTLYHMQTWFIFGVFWGWLWCQMYQDQQVAGSMRGQMLS